jgi:hypothetical protein
MVSLATNVLLGAAMRIFSLFVLVVPGASEVMRRWWFGGGWAVIRQ